MSIQLAKETCADAHTTATRSIVVDRHKDYDPDEPVMSQDSYHMGHKLGTNVHLLFATHPSEEMKYLVVVNSKTGESVMLHFNDGAAPPQTTLEETVKSNSLRALHELAHRCVQAEIERARTIAAQRVSHRLRKEEEKEEN